MLDEHAQGMITKIIMRILTVIETIFDGLGKEHILPVISVIGTVVIVCVIGYILTNLV